MKVTQQSPVLPSRPTADAAPVANVQKPEVAAAVAQPQAPAQRPERADLFGGAARAVAPEAQAETVVSSDPISGVGSKAAEKFFKGMGPTVHVVEKGDTLSKIARDHFPASYANDPWVPENIAMANGLEDPNLIRVGQELTLPGIYTYTVQSGDTLGKIAKVSNNALSDIVALNGIEDPNLIRVGQEIVLEGPYGEAWEVVAGHVYDTRENVTHTVKAGDTLSKLVRTYMPEAAGDAELTRLFVDMFAWENGLEDPNLIRVGQELKIPGLYTYEVQEGDSRWSLNLAINGGYRDDLLDAKGNPLKGEPQPGTVIRFRQVEYH